MRPDPDTCRDPDLLAAEVRRLRSVIESGEPTLTDAEREAVVQAIDAANGMGQAEPWTMRTLRSLLARLA